MCNLYLVILLLGVVSWSSVEAKTVNLFDDRADVLTQEDGFDKAIIYHLVACTPYGSSTSADLERGLTLAGTDCPQLKVKLLAPPGPVTFSVNGVDYTGQSTPLNPNDPSQGNQLSGQAADGTTAVVAASKTALFVAFVSNPDPSYVSTVTQYFDQLVIDLIVNNKQ